MRSAIPILICCLYALTAVEATFSSNEKAQVQQGNDKAAEPQKLWSDDKDYKEDKHEGGCPNDVRCNNLNDVRCNNLPAFPTAIACNNIPTASSASFPPYPTAVSCSGGTVACSTDCQIVTLLECLITSILAAITPIVTALTAFPNTLGEITALPGAIATLLTSIATALGILLDTRTGLLACFNGLCPVAA